ncbi:hypothetical protein ADUPG1_010222, partial [Aduncisulcus paluster]
MMCIVYPYSIVMKSFPPIVTEIMSTPYPIPVSPFIQQQSAASLKLVQEYLDKGDIDSAALECVNLRSGLWRGNDVLSVLSRVDRALFERASSKTALDQSTVGNNFHLPSLSLPSCFAITPLPPPLAREAPAGLGSFLSSSSNFAIKHALSLVALSDLCAKKNSTAQSFTKNVTPYANELTAGKFSASIRKNLEKHGEECGMYLIKHLALASSAAINLMTDVSSVVPGICTALEEEKKVSPALDVLPALVSNIQKGTDEWFKSQAEDFPPERLEINIRGFPSILPTFERCDGEYLWIYAIECCSKILSHCATHDSHVLGVRHGISSRIGIDRLPIILREALTFSYPLLSPAYDISMSVREKMLSDADNYALRWVKKGVQRGKVWAELVRKCLSNVVSLGDLDPFSPTYYSSINASCGSDSEVSMFLLRLREYDEHQLMEFEQKLMDCALVGEDVLRKRREEIERKRIERIEREKREKRERREREWREKKEEEERKRIARETLRTTYISAFPKTFSS